jgi:hypothetical protein
MDFIERLFHVCPDGGSGSTEAMYVLALFAVIAIVLRQPIGRAIPRIRCRRRSFQVASPPG